MKRIIFSFTIAMAAFAICVTNFAGTPAKTSVNGSRYVMSDTTPKKDTTKPDSASVAMLNSRYVMSDTTPKKDTTKPDSLSVAMLTR